MKLDPSNTELLSQKQKLLAEAISDTKDKLQTLKTASEQANEQLKQGAITQEQYDAFQREIEETEQALKKLESQASGTNAALAKIDEIGGKFQKAGKAMSDAGKTLSTTVTAPIVALGTAAVKTTADFDEQMSKVAAISGAAGKEFDDLRAKAREMGAKTKFSASEAGAAFEYMAMAGWKTEDMLSGIEGIMDLAAASGEDLATTSDIVTDALTAFGLKASDSGHFADILAAASSNANTNVSMMGETFKYAAPVAGALGYSAEDCALAIGMMANAGIKSSQAGTAIRSGLTRLVKPTKQVATAMEKYGISITDSHGKMYSMDEMIQQLRKKLGGLSEAEQGAAAAAIFGTNAMSGWLAIINGSDEDMNKLKTAIANCTYQVDDIAKSLESSGIAWDKYSKKSWAKGGKGTQKVTEEIINCLDKMGMSSEATVEHLVKKFGLTAEEAQTAFDTVTKGMEESTGSAKSMAARMLDNLNGQITILKSALQELLIQIGDALMPTVRKIVSAVQAFVEKLQSMDEGTRNTIIKIAAFAAAIGPALLVVGKLTSSVGGAMRAFSSLGKGLLAIGSKVTGASGGMGMLKSAIAAITSPVAIVIAAVAALGAAFATLWKNNEKFREKITSIWNHLVGNFQHFTKRIVDRINSLGFNFTSIVDVLKSAWEGFCNFLAPIFTAAFRIIHNILTGAMNTIVAILDVFIGIFKGDWDKAWEGVKRIVSNTWKTIQVVITDVVRIVRHIIDGFLGLFGTDWNTVWSSVSTFFSNTWAGITNFFNTSIATIKRVWGTVSDFFQGVWNGVQGIFANVTGFFSGIFGNAKQAVVNAWDNIKGFFSGIWTTITTDGGLASIWEKLSAPFKNAWSAIETAWNDVASFFSDIWTSITGGEGLKGILDAIKKPFVDAYNAIKGVWDTVTGWFSGIFGGVKDDQNLGGVESAISSPFTSAWATISGKFEGIGATIKGWFGTIDVSAAVAGVSSWVSDAWATISGKFENIGATIKNWFGTIDVTSVVAGVSSWVSTAWSTITGKFENIGATIKSWFGTIDVSAAVAGVSSWVSDAWTTIMGKFENVGATIKGWFGTIDVTSAVAGVSSWVSTAWTTITGKFENIGTTIKNWFGTIDLTDAVAGVSSWCESSWKTISDTFGNAAADIVGYFGGMDFSGIIADVSSWATTAWNDIQNAFAGVQTFFSDAFSVIGTTITNVTNDISTWATNTWNSIKAPFEEGGGVSTWFQTTFSGVKDTISKAVGDIGSWASQAWSDVKSAAVSVGDWFANLFGWGSSTENATAQAEENAAAAGLEVKNSLIKSFEGADTEVAAVFKNLLTLSQESINQLKTDCDTAAKEIIASFTKIETDFKTSSTNIGTEIALLLKGVTTTLDSMKTSVSDAATEMQKTVDDAKTAISAFFSTLHEDMKTTATNIGTTITTILTGVRTTMDSMKESLEKTLSGMKTSAETALSGISTAFTSMKDTIGTVTDEAGRKLVTLNTGIKNVLDSIKQAVSGAVDDTGKKLSILSTGVSGIFHTMKQAVDGNMADIRTVMMTVMDAVTMSAEIWGANIGTMLANGLGSTFSNFVDQVKAISDAAKTVLSAISLNAYVWGADIATLLANGIYANANRVIQAARYLAQSVRDVLGFSLPKKGPLSDADTYMPDFVNLLAGGIRDSRQKLMDSVGALAESMNKALTGMVIPSMNAGQLALAGPTTNNRTVNVGGIHVSINGYQAQDDADLANMVARRLNEELNRESAVWG